MITETGLNDLIGYAEAANLLGIAPGTAYVWVYRKQIPHIRISSRCVRFSRKALLAWLEARQVPEGGKPQ